MSEHPAGRATIDEMTRNLIKNDPVLARDPQKARKIAQDAARRHHHNESIQTEGRKRG